MTSSRGLWKYSSNDNLQIPPQNIYRYTRSCLHVVYHTIVSHLLDALWLALPQFPDVPTLTAQLSQYATSFAWVQLSYAPSAVIRRGGARMCI